MSARVVAVCVSYEKGEAKRDVGMARFVDDFGIEGDAHAGKWHRQVSLLASESIDEMRAKGLELEHGAFGENLVVQGIELDGIPVGTLLEIGDGVKLQVTQLGKKCHDHCAIYEQVGYCIMPTQGVFARVMSGGDVKVGDSIKRLETQA